MQLLYVEIFLIPFYSCMVFYLYLIMISCVIDSVSSINRYLDHFQFFTIINSAVINSLIHTSLHGFVNSSLVSGIDYSKGKCILNFDRFC
jgi:hypothetical protein